MTGEVNKREFRSFDPREDSPGWDFFLTNLQSYWSSPEDAKVLMEHFCYCVEHNKEIPKPILEYLKDAFTDFIYDNKTLEASFKLKKKPGRSELPGPDIYPGDNYVFWILEHILAGKNQEQAMNDTLEALNAPLNDESEHYHLSTIRDHFKLYKDNALRAWLSMKAHYEQELTSLELQQIKEYFPDFSTKN